mgnify:CR=1 FL=1
MTVSLLNKIDHHSVSSVQKWADCPRSWWVNYVLGEQLPSSVAASFGSQYDILVSKKLGLQPKEEPTELVEGVEDAVSGYFSQEHAFRDASVAQGEVNITPGQWSVFGEMHDLCVEIAKPVLGFIDLEDPLRGKLVDLKTSSGAGSQPKWGFQVLIYALARHYGQAEIHLMTRTKNPAWYRYMVPVEPQALKWAMTNFTFYANQIEDALRSGNGENLARNPGFYCSWCAEQINCPARSIIY